MISCQIFSTCNIHSYFHSFILCLFHLSYLHPSNSCSITAFLVLRMSLINILINEEVELVYYTIYTLWIWVYILNILCGYDMFDSYMSEYLTTDTLHWDCSSFGAICIEKPNILYQYHRILLVPPFSAILYTKKPEFGGILLA